ncbi:hypothetical protein H1S01_06470 [Heliobacterium chlorum]|uniref:Inhibitor of sigma-G Gin n=1 Tax=Heliobacterium chlorum TaxID=2698 RepID=A0ABR7T031_HELCL|nr:sigma factor G inhibitor Gin [Heliobacterium chlorum]MBC9784154.1 hypothetical protein [Heliobacterium chlorum]
MNLGKVLPVCSACRCTPPEGLAGGIWFKGLFLCEDCLNNLSEWQENERPYLLLKESLAGLWRHHPAWRHHLAYGSKS